MKTFKAFASALLTMLLLVLLAYGLTSKRDKGVLTPKQVDAICEHTVGQCTGIRVEGRLPAGAHDCDLSLDNCERARRMQK